MKMAEASGKTKEEAIATGIKILRVRQEEVDYKIISQNENETKLEISVKEPHQHILELTKYILTSCGFNPNISVTKDKRGFYINIKTRHSDAILIGKKGETLWSLQYLLSRLLKRFHPNLKILVDVGSYRVRRNNFLKKKAEAVARIVLRTGREMALDPLTRREQQLVEHKLAEIKGIRVYTIGRGANKNVIIAPSNAPK